MNIFILDEDPIIAARSQCDRHVIKMIVESVQMMSTTLILNGFSAPYKITHKNHPCSIWSRASRSNHNWHWQMVNELQKEYTRRYHKIHKSGQILLDHIPEDLDFLPDIGLTEFVNCTPYKDLPTIEAYKKFYNIDKAKFATWKMNKPEWFV